MFKSTDSRRAIVRISPLSSVPLLARLVSATAPTVANRADTVTFNTNNGKTSTYTVTVGDRKENRVTTSLTTIATFINAR